MDQHHLVEMVNDIGDFFAPANPPAQAAVEVAAHLRRSWDPRMRRAIVALWRTGQGEFSDVGREAIALLAKDTTAAG